MDDNVTGALATERTKKVCIIHHNDMQLHTPPHYDDIYELPRRVIAIENKFKGLELCTGFPCEGCFGGKMQVLPSSPGVSPKKTVAFGSVAPIKKRIVHSAGPSCKGAAWDACVALEAPEVDESDLLRVHSEKHVRNVKELCGLAASENAALFPIDPEAKQPCEKPKPDELLEDNYYSPESLIAMKRAAGGATEAVRQLFRIDAATGRAVERSVFESSFALVRPPGHHCCDEPFGFCYFSNTAIAAKHAREVLGLSRVAIVDWDYHHGDGQQKIFYEDPSVLTVSLHVAMTENGLAFPACKELGVEYFGSGPGSGYNINIPWPHDEVGLREYEEAFQTIVIPALIGFKPELILVAAGFDAMEGDILAGTRMTARGYYNMTEKLLSLNLPVAVILEGGYSPSRISEAALNVMHALLKWQVPEESNANTMSANEADTNDENPAQCILDVVKTRLNQLHPWNEIRSPYFSESTCDITASENAFKKITQRFEKLLAEQEEEKPTSLYKHIGGIKYDRSLLEKAEEFARDGRISFAEASVLWELAQDGNRVTLTEKRTLHYTMKKFNYTEKAARFMRPLVKEGAPKSCYIQIDNVKYDRRLYEMAQSFAKNGISGAEARALWDDAQETGGKVTEVERRTLEYTMTKFKYTEAATNFLAPLLKQARAAKSRSPRRAANSRSPRRASKSISRSPQRVSKSKLRSPRRPPQS